MTSPVLNLRSMTAAQRREGIARAAELLGRGACVVLPTETVYGLCARADMPQAAELFAKITNRSGPLGSIWHAHDAARVIDALGITDAVHQRLVRRLSPGPVRFLIPTSTEEIARVCRGLGVKPGTIDDGACFAVRIPGHETAREVLSACGGVVIAEKLPGPASYGRSGLSLDASVADRITLALDDGPPSYGVPSTAVRLLPGGGYEILPGGALTPEQVRERFEHVVLFVCTGNTCRSPMARAIAQDLIVRQGRQGLPVRFESAGVSAQDGAPATPATAAALRELGVEAPRHRSRHLTKEMVRRADVIYTMTASQAQAVLELESGAAAKVRPIDPSGADIEDPIGGSEEVYIRTARALAGLIRTRLSEEGLLRDEAARPVGARKEGSAA